MFRRAQEIPRKRPENTTQPGSPKSVFSYYGKSGPPRSGERTEPTAMHTSSKGRGRALPALIVVVIISSVLLSLTLSTRPSISFVDGQQAVYKNAGEYEAAAQAILSSQLSNQTKLTINTKNVERLMLEKFPELAAAAIRLPVVGRRASLVLELRSPAALLVASSRTYVLDASGQVVSDLQGLSPSARANLPAVVDESGFDLKPGDYAVTSETVNFIVAATAQLKAQNIVVTKLTLPPLANQLNITIKDAPYYIKTDVSGDPRLQIGSFLAVRDKLSAEKITPGEYIDVRVEEKVFYK